MVVDDFHVVSVSVPVEADPPLIVDANAPLPGAVTRKPFQAIAGWLPEVFDACHLVQLLQLPKRPGLNL
jgi:hypothetical protein